MRADRLPIYGFSGIKTPTLERFSAGGAVFEQAFAAAPLTLLLHASLFTDSFHRGRAFVTTRARPLPKRSQRWLK